MSFKKNSKLICLAIIAGNISTLSVAQTTQDENAKKIAALSAAVKADKARSARLEKQVDQLSLELEQQKAAKPATVKETTNKQLISAGTRSQLKSIFKRKERETKFSRNASYNQDLKILFTRQKIVKEAAKDDISLYYPHVDMGGSVSGSYAYNWNYDYTQSSDVNLTATNVNIDADIARFFTTYISLSYDSSPPQGTILNPPSSVVRIANSRLFLSKGFITVGDLSSFPLYFSIGQMATQFGDFNSLVFTPPLTARLGRTTNRIVELGFAQADPSNGFNAQIYAFRGDSSSVKPSVINNGGANLGYAFAQGDWTITTGISYVANIADSGGMQLTNNPFLGSDEWWVTDEDTGEEFVVDEPVNQFAGFGADKTQEKLAFMVPGLDGRLSVSYGHFTVLGEYTSAATAFSRRNLLYNGGGATPAALAVEAGYNFKIHDMDSRFAFAYNQTFQAFSLNMPQQRYALAFRFVPCAYVITGIEYGVNVNYPVGTTGGGQGLPLPKSAYKNLGKTANALILNLGVSF